ncbi:MAG: hypothetical protein KGN39_03680 [Betaproteobacteria bacterium]|nr:hypothetical protein [Betaproteobacteria bacterium]
MNARAKTWRWLGVAVISALLGLANGAVATAAGSAGGVNGAKRDALDQPSRQSERAKSAVLMAITVAGERLVAVGEGGIVLLSDDNGRSWRQAKAVPTSVALTGVRFASANTGWAVGHSGVVLKSSDGGETWVRQLDGKQAAAIELAAADAAAAGSAAMTRRQRDAQGLVADGADKPFLDLHAFDDRHCFVVGAYGLAFGTRDGGQTWESMVGQIDNPKGRHLYSITATRDALVIAGEQGTLLQSEDQGLRFAPVPIAYPGTLFGSVSTNDGALVVFGLRGNAFRSADQGRTWNKVDFGLPVTLTAGMRLRDGRLAVVDETGRVLLSRDGGSKFAALDVAKMNAATGIAEAADGALVVSTQRGAVRIAPEAFRSEQKK